MSANFRREFFFDWGFLDETLAERELRGVHLEDPSLGLGSKQLLLEPTKLLFDFFQSSVRSENEIDQLVASGFVKSFPLHILLISKLTSPAKRNAIQNETKCLV